jgi:HD superfamily phosphohydrolase
MPIKRSGPGNPGLPLSAETDTLNKLPIDQPSTKAERQEFFLPVTGFVWFYPEEVRVINHPAFQRLSRINQLGQAHLVFRGATHKRIEHVLGVVGVVQRMISAVQFNSEKSRARGRVGFSAPLSDQEQRFVRLGALLHDIGHLAAGHTLEDELEIIDKHDADERLDLIWDKPDWDGSADRGVLTLRQVIDAEFKKYVPPGLASKGFSATDIVRLLIRKRPTADKYAEKQGQIEKSSEIRQHVCSNMIGNTICADLLDYIYRDWYHVGKPRSAEDRIFQYMEIRRLKKADAILPATPLKADYQDRFVISLGEKTKIRTDGVSAILGLLEWRYELAETVLFHRTKLAAGAMLDRALYEVWESQDEKSLVDRLLPLSDDQLIDEALKDARTQRTSTERSENFDAAISLLQKLRDRALFKELRTFDSTNLPQPYIPDIKKSYAGLGAATKEGAKCRAQTARLLETDFELPPGSIAIYCSHVKPKIAEVSIDVDGEISTFSEFEKKHKNRLSGGIWTLK